MDRRNGKLSLHSVLRMCLIGLALFCLGRTLVPRDYRSVAEATFETADRPELKFSRTKIDSIRVGQRVLGRNPEIEQHTRSANGEPDWRRWLNLSLQMTKGDGIIEIEMLRPAEWVNAQNAQPGQLIDLDLTEMGAVGPAEVLKIEAGPKVQDPPGHVVTATFKHIVSGRLLNAFFDADPQPIGVTAGHPFWSVDDQTFRSIEEIPIGCRVRTYEGITRRLTRRSDRPGPAIVYNLEVHGEHCYFVGPHGILVHNSCSRKLGDNIMGGKTDDGEMMRRLGFEAHHIVAENKPIFQRLRQLLARNNIDDKIDRVNGVWLPGPRIKSEWPKSILHRGRGAGHSLHGKESVQKLEERLLDLDGDELAIRAELEIIGREIQDGTF